MTKLIEFIRAIILTIREIKGELDNKFTSWGERL